MREGNYSIMQERARALFLEYDQNVIASKPFVSETDGFFIVSMLGEEYRIDRCSGEVLKACGETAGFDEALTVYDLLTHDDVKSGAMTYEGRKADSMTGEVGNANGRAVLPQGKAKPDPAYCTLQSLDASRRVSSGELGELYGGTARYFEEHLADFKRNAERTGHGFDGKGDLNYEFPLFDFMNIRVSLWLSDDEFPASMKIYVDTGILDFILYETVYYAIGHLLDKLKETI